MTLKLSILIIHRRQRRKQTVCIMINENCSFLKSKILLFLFLLSKLSDRLWFMLSRAFTPKDATFLATSLIRFKGVYHLKKT